MRQISLLVADSQPVARAGLFSFFSGTNIQIVDYAQTCEETINKTMSAGPDALILAADFPDGSGFDATQKLRAKRFRGKILFFESTGRRDYLARALAVGADSYVLKSATRAELAKILNGLVEQLDAPEDTERDFSGELRQVSTLMRKRRVDPTNPLSAREAQVLRHVVLGLSNREIGLALKVSEDTVKDHMQNILRKLDVRDRAQAAVWAIRNNLIP